MSCVDNSQPISNLTAILFPCCRHVDSFKLGFSQRNHEHNDDVLNVWCLHPGVIFQPLSQQCRSMILASGTLSPMDGTISELDTTFSVRLEAPHIISAAQQLRVVAVPEGPHGHALLGTYKHASTEEYLVRMLCTERLSLVRECRKSSRVSDLLCGRCV